MDAGEYSALSFWSTFTSFSVNTFMLFSVNEAIESSEDPIEVVASPG